MLPQQIIRFRLLFLQLLLQRVLLLISTLPEIVFIHEFLIRNLRHFLMFSLVCYNSSLVICILCLIQGLLYLICHFMLLCILVFIHKVFLTLVWSTSMGDYIMARMIYKCCVVFIFHRETLVDPIQLDTIDFDVILGIGFIHAMHIEIVGPRRSVFTFLIRQQ